MWGLKSININMPGYFQIFHALNCTNCKKCRVGNVYCCRKETSPLPKSPCSLSLSLSARRLNLCCLCHLLKPDLSNKFLYSSGKKREPRQTYVISVSCLSARLRRTGWRRQWDGSKWSKRDQLKESHVKWLCSDIDLMWLCVIKPFCIWMVKVLKVR